jgi:hypothetical protein
MTESRDEAGIECSPMHREVTQSCTERVVEDQRAQHATGILYTVARVNLQVAERR